MKNKFKIGQKIFCIERTGEIPKYYKPLVENCIYTIRGFTPTNHILLQEIVNPPIPLKDKVFREIGYKPSRFRMIKNLKKIRL
jgi:hypothetical protein